MPGEVSSKNSRTDIVDSQLELFESGLTYRFVVNLYDIYDNPMDSGIDLTQIEILASYQHHDEWPSPINEDDLHNWRELYG